MVDRFEIFGIRYLRDKKRTYFRQVHLRYSFHSA